MRASSTIQSKRIRIRSSAQSTRRATRPSRSLAERKDIGVSDVDRKLGGMLVGIGGLTAAVALLCCIAPWLLAGFFVALGLGFLLNDVLLMAVAGMGVLVALLGL